MATTMTDVEIRAARLEKTRFLWCFLVVVVSAASKKIFYPQMPPDDPRALFIAGLAVVSGVSLMILTWRFARAIRLKTPMTVLNTVLAGTFAIVPAVVLMRLYGERTGLPIAFWKRETPPSAPPAV